MSKFVNNDFMNTVLEKQHEHNRYMLPGHRNQQLEKFRINVEDTSRAHNRKTCTSW